MAQSKYYSPRLEHTLISPLYHAAKSQGIPMTALASRFVAEGLSRMEEPQAVTCPTAKDSPPT